MKFSRICAVVAAVRCLNAGQSFKEIARSAKRSPSTIRRRVNQAGFHKFHGQYQITA